MATIRERKSFRILSLDGGGTWALIQAKVLMDVYGADWSGHEILKDFDLVAANSGGSIVAAGLIADMTPAEILRLFMVEASRKTISGSCPGTKRIPLGILEKLARNFRQTASSRGSRRCCVALPPAHSTGCGYSTAEARAGRVLDHSLRL